MKSQDCQRVPWSADEDITGRKLPADIITLIFSGALSPITALVLQQIAHNDVATT